MCVPLDEDEEDEEERGNADGVVLNILVSDTLYFLARNCPGGGFEYATSEFRCEETRS